jgi:hypothetical protein
MKSLTIKEIQEELADVLVERTVQEWACALSEDATSLRSSTSISEQEAAAGEVFTALAGFCKAAGVDLEKAITRRITWMVNDQ